MRIVNENYETIDRSEVDLTKGILGTAIVIREDAIPIDNITKFVWNDDDYEEVELYTVLPDFLIKSPSDQDLILDILADQEERLCLLELFG